MNRPQPTCTCMVQRGALALLGQGERAEVNISILQRKKAVTSQYEELKKCLVFCCTAKIVAGRPLYVWSFLWSSFQGQGMHKVYIPFHQVFNINSLPCNKGTEGIRTSNTYNTVQHFVCDDQTALSLGFILLNIFNRLLGDSSDNIQIVTVQSDLLFDDIQ